MNMRGGRADPGMRLHMFMLYIMYIYLINTYTYALTYG